MTRGRSRPTTRLTRAPRRRQCARARACAGGMDSQHEQEVAREGDDERPARVPLAQCRRRERKKKTRRALPLPPPPHWRAQRAALPNALCASGCSARAALASSSKPVPERARVSSSAHAHAQHAEQKTRARSNKMAAASQRSNRRARTNAFVDVELSRSSSSWRGLQGGLAAHADTATRPAERLAERRRDVGAGRLRPNDFTGTAAGGKCNAAQHVARQIRIGAAPRSHALASPLRAASVVAAARRPPRLRSACTAPSSAASDRHEQRGTSRSLLRRELRLRLARRAPQPAHLQQQPRLGDGGERERRRLAVRQQAGAAHPLQDRDGVALGRAEERGARPPPLVASPRGRARRAARFLQRIVLLGARRPCGCCSEATAVTDGVRGVSEVGCADVRACR